MEPAHFLFLCLEFREDFIPFCIFAALAAGATHTALVGYKRWEWRSINRLAECSVYGSLHIHPLSEPSGGAAPVPRINAIAKRSSAENPRPQYDTAPKLQRDTVPRVRREAQYRAWVILQLHQAQKRGGYLTPLNYSATHPTQCPVYPCSTDGTKNNR